MVLYLAVASVNAPKHLQGVRRTSQQSVGESGSPAAGRIHGPRRRLGKPLNSSRSRIPAFVVHSMRLLCVRIHGPRRRLRIRRRSCRLKAGELQQQVSNTAMPWLCPKKKALKPILLPGQYRPFAERGTSPHCLAWQCGWDGLAQGTAGHGSDPSVDKNVMQCHSKPKYRLTGGEIVPQAPLHSLLGAAFHSLLDLNTQNLNIYIAIYLWIFLFLQRKIDPFTVEISF